MNSVKSQIINRLLAICEPLKAECGLRKVVRARTLFLLEPVKPCLHLVVSDEQQIGEDQRGYTLQFMAMFKLIVSDARDPYALTDTMTAFLQTHLEADRQLLTLCNKITYDGEIPFTEEELKPEGGTVLSYVIEYRRERANPEQNY